ncbi:MAG: hypothetical protein A2945_05070 [Candidatus Liptonbacteria bacterium RIFCSPLOWO2_01_FULL_52_25]|uniref:HTH arsR-type domain-containing protein n=1 Tax=Candidatus Liptonbacteria bacterium RIFCSPLOWO2_01_FULL_52_25 TaxID=1798650 RepID=A0A1G2CD50_9BACT|nr:MAG: hypothetical protein A2945_05070 [Candidatus Liptonbacteria bacterium RIFCSPLOWO2_01_FULL_52_25]
MKEVERILKAFANKRRIAIVKYLKNNRDATVGDIAAEINLSFKATSKHLGILSTADILEKEQHSLQVHYRLASSQKPVARAIIHLL